MPNLPLPPGVKETAGAIWLGIRAAMPDSCLAAADEKLNFAKGRQQKTENVEMLAVSGERQEGPSGEGVEGGFASSYQDGGVVRPRGGSQGSSSTVGVEADHDMITEWQAGWNVTNAIQVGK